MDDKLRYQLACHAMQSGVKFDMETNTESEPGTSPKHLRVGINVALRDHGSLIRLLIDKGIITLAEYEKAIADGMEEEKESYEQMLSDRIGRKVKLG